MNNEFLILIFLITLSTICNFVITFLLFKVTKNNKPKDNTGKFNIDFSKEKEELDVIIEEVFQYFLKYIFGPKLLSNKGLINDEFTQKVILEMSLKVLNLLSKDYKEKILKKYFNDIEDYIIFSLSSKFNDYAIKHNLKVLSTINRNAKT